jgi:hypothetical protein
MRSTGGRHVPLLANLSRFDRFLAHAYPHTTTITKEILRAWFASFEHLRPSSQARYRTATFQVCKFLRRRDASTATREDILSPRVRRDFHPYIFSSEEIVRLLRAAGAQIRSGVDRADLTAAPAGCARACAAEAAHELLRPAASAARRFVTVSGSSAYRTMSGRSSDERHS